MAIFYVDGAVGNDSNAGTSPGSGNAWLTIAHALATIASGDLCYVKASATYTIGTGLTFATTGSSPTRLIGYASSPGDNGRATIQASAAVVGLTFSGQYCYVENFVFDGNSTGTSGIVVNTSSSLGSIGTVNCIIKNWTSHGWTLTASGGSASIQRCEITANTGDGVHINNVSGIGGVVQYCRIHGNGGAGVSANTGLLTYANINSNLIYSNVGDGIASGYGSVSITNNTIHGNATTAGNGISSLTGNVGVIMQNILTNNGIGSFGFGIKLGSTNGGLVQADIDYNAYFGNSSGSYSNCVAGPNDFSLSGLPYINAGVDFSLNNVAGQGALLRGTGLPGTFP